MGAFIIDKTDFGIGKVICSINMENSVIEELVISGDEALFEKLSEEEDGQWSWALYPPELYFRGIPFATDGRKIRARINEAISDDQEVALYMMEHNDFTGEIFIENNQVSISGETDLMGELMKVELSFEVVR